MTGESLAGIGGDVPLARLLGLAYRTLVDGLHERLRARGWHDVRPTYGYVLLACRSRQPTSSDVAALLGVSKQAAAKLVESMVAADLLARTSLEGDGRAKPLRLTRRGRRLLHVVEEIYQELEGEWAEVLGPADLRRLHEGLLTMMTAVHGESLPLLGPR